MHPRHFLTLAALLTSGVAFGQTTLNWADIDSWSLGLSTGSYNTLAGAGAANSSINTLNYDLGSGLIATVSVARDAGVTWQTSSNYGGYAPAVTSDGVLGVGIEKASGVPTALGATYTIHFNQAVTLDTFSIGDIDSARDVVAITTNSGALSVSNQSASRVPTISTVGNTITLTSTINYNEPLFNPNAPSSWVELTSGTTALTDLTVTLSGSSGTSHGVWLSSLEVTAAIPEPSTYAAVLGACTLALVVWRRRARD
ncbi:MAG TPA: PEP-CTERM sorting domain-containing protein [Opitutaceae bacterium]|nr:PEP-CTERM sorting domain-containing protein [Opitutaceae bacterium]